MPFRETYEINSRDEGKAAQRDQSYKSCVITLLIFFFLCLILIIACIPWKIQNLTDNTHNTHNINQHIRQESQHEKQAKQMTTISSKMEVIPITTTKTTRRHINTITEEYIEQDIESRVESFSPNTITKDEIVMAPVIASEDETDRYAKEILQYTKNVEEDLTMTQHDVINNTIENNVTLTSPNTQMTHDITIKHILNTIEPIINTKSIEENMTDEYSSNTIHNTMKLELVETSTDFDKFETTTVNTITEDTVTSTMLNLFTDFKENTNTKYIFDQHHHEKSQFKTSNLTTLTSTRSFEENRNIEEFTTKYSKETVTSENYKTSTNEIKTEDSILNMTNYETIEKYDKHITFDTAEKYNISSTNNPQIITAASSDFYNTTIIIIPENQDEMYISTTEDTTLSDENICETGYCKQIASKMLSYMNHSADPCEDFYEYACGGFEANSQLIDGKTVLKFRNYQRIAKQMSKKKYEDSVFTTYYNSCVQYEKIMNFSERVKMATDALSKIGKFYIPATWSNNYVDFTDLFTQLILHHNALLFDIVPELDEFSSNSFTLKISPAMYENPFMDSQHEDLCSEDEFETKEQYVDLKFLYNNYKKCKYDTRELMKSIKETLIIFNVFKGVNDSYLEWHTQLKHINSTVHIIDSIIMQEYFSQFLFKNEIRESSLMSNYNKISLKELENNCTFINWTQLINSLGVNEINGNDKVYVYVTLIENLQKLEKFSRKDPMNFNNAIMGLYAYKLYRELVTPRRNNVKDHCLQVAIYLLRLEASSLYISSFVDHEITQINKIIENTFNELKQTLRLEIKDVQWAINEEREQLLQKIDSLKLALPAVSFFQDRDSLYNEYMSQIFLNDNYFNNTMILLKWYRSLMYAELRGQIDDPKQIWTYYATPFQSQARVIYNLNLNVIPYGIIDWSLLNNEFSFNYLILATLGNLIAQQIAHHFDADGIYYWNDVKNPQSILIYENSFNINFNYYMDCQKNNLYQGSMNITLPFTDQIVSFVIPRSTLNERLSDIMGLRLAYDTLVRTMSDAEKKLPWIKFRTEQLFYLAYAQMYCTKKPLTSSYVSLYENENLPSRIRVFISASNNKPLAEMWNCAIGSQVAPIDVCSVFPYLDFEETM